MLEGSLRVINPTSAPLNGTFDLVIPKQLASSVKNVAFDPQPQVVQEDPVVRYSIAALPRNSVETLGYAIRLRQAPSPSDVASWVTDQAKAQAAYTRAEARTLASLSLGAGTVHFTAGQTYQLTLTGSFVNGDPAPETLLAYAVWASSDPSVVAVIDGRLTANSAGSATVTAQVGGATATLGVTTVPVPVPRPPTNVASQGGSGHGTRSGTSKVRDSAAAHPAGARAARLRRELGDTDPAGARAAPHPAGARAAPHPAGARAALHPAGARAALHPAGARAALHPGFPI